MTFRGTDSESHITEHTLVSKTIAGVPRRHTRAEHIFAVAGAGPLAHHRPHLKSSAPGNADEHPTFNTGKELIT